MTMKQTNFYKKYGKRALDIVLSASAFLVLFPLFLALLVIGAIAMWGNPLFVQKRPGQRDQNGRERIFPLLKFRTMTNKTDASGQLLCDEARLNGYGRFLRRTSLDELPQLLNVIVGDCSLIGPRPLLVEYLPLYSQEQRRRHEVRPGITGYAQVHGRNAISWQEKFELDVYYVDHLSFSLDVQVFFATIRTILSGSGIGSGTSETMEPFLGNKPLEAAKP